MTNAILKCRVVAAVTIVVVSSGCMLPPNWQSLEYDGGSVGGYLKRPEPRLTAVIIELGSAMAERTTIDSGDGELMRLADVTPAMLLRRGEVLWYPSEGERIGGYRIHDLDAFDHAKTYQVLVGTRPCGPIYSFRVTGGEVRSMAAGGSTGACPGGHTAAVFVAPNGERHAIPIDPDAAVAIWGRPIRIEKMHIGGL